MATKQQKVANEGEAAERGRGQPSMPGYTEPAVFQTMREETYAEGMEIQDFMQGEGMDNSKPETSGWAPGDVNLMFGNPSEVLHVPGFVDALRKALEPRGGNHFRYNAGEPDVFAAVGRSITAAHGKRRVADDGDILLTTGAIAGLYCSLRALVCAGDEVVYFSPYWFGYHRQIQLAGGDPVVVPIPLSEGCAFPLDALAARLTPRTRVVIVNTPHNPTGRIVTPEELRGLAALLERHSAEVGRRVWVISDQAYHRVLYKDAPPFYSPCEFYPHSVLVYTWGKQLVAPAQRVGYVALPRAMPPDDRDRLRANLRRLLMSTGFQVPNVTMQRALVNGLDDLGLDMDHYAAKRDTAVRGLAGAGYSIVYPPEATFYILVRTPAGVADVAFCRRLRELRVFVLPGICFGHAGFFRLCLTAPLADIERAVPLFADAMRELGPPAP